MENKVLLCYSTRQTTPRPTATAAEKLGGAVLDDAARAPLASLCRQGARGLIPHAAWEAAIAEAVPTPRIMSFEGEAKRHAWSALLAALREALPSSAHEQRIRRALATLSRFHRG